MKLWRQEKYCHCARFLVFSKDIIFAEQAVRCILSDGWMELLLYYGNSCVAIHNIYLCKQWLWNGDTEHLDDIYKYNIHIYKRRHCQLITFKFCF